VNNLPWLFTGTLLVMLVVSPLFAYIVSRFPKDRFIAISYRFFAANLVIFAGLLVIPGPLVRGGCGTGGIE
jgi:AAA family ATP:ADP antiporter